LPGSDIQIGRRNLSSPKQDNSCNKRDESNVSDCELAKNVLENSAGSGDREQKRIVVPRTKEGIGEPSIDGASGVVSLQL
jgi:hypothetical protein